MKFLVLLTITLFAVFTTSNALQCSPITCLVVCPYGYNVDAQGCPYCSCRTSPEPCNSPLLGYNCGSIDKKECPSSHRCQLSSGGYYGQCCLRESSSTVAPTVVATSKTPSGTTSRGTTSRLLKLITGYSVPSGTGSSGAPATTPSSVFASGTPNYFSTFGFGRRSAGTDSSSATTPSSVTNSGTVTPSGTTGNAKATSGATTGASTRSFGRRSAGTDSVQSTTAATLVSTPSPVVATSTSH